MQITSTPEGESTWAKSPGAAPEQPWPPAKQAYFMVFVSALVVMFAEVDRGVITLLVQPIKQAFNLSDTSMGVLMGLAFGLPYAFAGVLLSRFVDRNNRKNLLSLALAFWSAATVFCGLAQTYIQLMFARAFLGVGESVNGPSIFSMISDSFPRERLPRAIALMQLGVTAGGAFSLIMGAVIIKLLMNMQPIPLPGIGVIKWWQMVFILIGLPGFAVALFQALTVKEPARRGVSHAAGAAKVGLVQVASYIGQHWKVFWPQFGSMGVSALAMGSLAWAPTFYIRTFHMSPVTVGLTSGTIALIASPIGLFLGVVVVEWLSKRGVVDAPYKVIAWGGLIALPFAIMLPLMPSPYLAFAMSAVGQIMIGATGSSRNAILQIVTPNQMRGQMTSIMLLLFTVVGNSLSPVLLGMVTDYIFRDESQIRFAMLSTTLAFTPLSLLIFWSGMGAYRRELTRLGLAPA